MEAQCGTTLRFSSLWIGSEKIGGKLNGFMRFSQRFTKDYRLKLINLSDMRWRSELNRHRRVCLTLVSHACEDSHDPALESGSSETSFDENWLLKNKANEVASCLNGRCVFLVGMMGSGKTTVGKILSEALGYCFVDSDKYVEQAVGSSIDQIFEQHGESFFRDYESEALQKLSLMPQQLVATGGGAVILPINWKYMKHGITVYLNVPLDALARRIAAVGFKSRPLLHSESGDAYTKAFTSLFTLSKKRGHAYINADATVCLQRIATKLGLEDVYDITPNAIALEALVQIENFLKGHSGMSIQVFP